MLHIQNMHGKPIDCMREWGKLLLLVEPERALPDQHFTTQE